MELLSDAIDLSCDAHELIIGRSQLALFLFECLSKLLDGITELILLRLQSVLVGLEISSLLVQELLDLLSLLIDMFQVEINVLLFDNK